MLFIVAIRCPLATFAIEIKTKITRNIRNTLRSEYPAAQSALSVEKAKSKNVAHPYATDATTAKRPIRFNQPV
jgi:hypothetical protein